MHVANVAIVLSYIVHLKPFDQSTLPTRIIITSFIKDYPFHVFIEKGNFIIMFPIVLEQTIYPLLCEYHELYIWGFTIRQVLLFTPLSSIPRNANMVRTAVLYIILSYV